MIPIEVVPQIYIYLYSSFIRCAGQFVRVGFTSLFPRSIRFTSSQLYINLRCYDKKIAKDKNKPNCRKGLRSYTQERIYIYIFFCNQTCREDKVTLAGSMYTHTQKGMAADGQFQRAKKKN